jgi:hypothetical protein
MVGTDRPADAQMTCLFQDLLSAFPYKSYFCSCEPTYFPLFYAVPQARQPHRFRNYSTSYKMGLFGSSRKKPYNPFQAAAEQQRQQGLATRVRQRQPESSHLRPGWDKSPIVHPYGQPGFGFYSGENLAAGSRPRQREPSQPTSVDDGLRGRPPQPWSGPLSPGPPFPPHQVYPAPSFENCEAGCLPLVDLDAWAALRPPASPYRGPEEQLLVHPDHYFADYVPGTRVLPLSSSTSSGAPHFPPRNIPLDASRYRERPIFDGLRPFRNSPVPNPYIALDPSRNGPPHRHPAWNPFPDGIVPMRAPGTPARPPGSYERLRPPHLQLGNGRAGGGGGTRSSSSHSRGS